MAPTFSRPVVLQEEARRIFFVIDGFLRSTSTIKRSSDLESFPASFDAVPWRQVYKPPAGEQSTSDDDGPVLQRWEPCELSLDGAGNLWCFIELRRNGENISRKTEDGQTWISKSGRVPKNGFPDQIRVDKLVITDKSFDMLELTLDLEKPIVALCKIRRKINSVAASPQISIPSISSPEAQTSQQVEGFPVPEGFVDTHIDQPQGCIQYAEQDDDFIYQGAVSFLYEKRGSFRYYALYSRDEAREIASTIQAIAYTFRNVLNFLGINTETRINRRESSLNNTQVMETVNSSVAAPGPQLEMQDAFLGQAQAQLTGEFPVYNFNEWELLDFDEGNVTDFDQAQDMY